MADVMWKEGDAIEGRINWKASEAYVCPGCETLLDGAFRASKENEQQPEVGDFTFCMHCGTPAEFMEGFALRRVPNEELEPMFIESFRAHVTFHVLAIERNFKEVELTCPITNCQWSMSDSTRLKQDLLLARFLDIFKQ